MATVASATTATAATAGHELLLRLAGRVPDELLWRLRDWLDAPGAGDAVGSVLPRTLLRHRIGLDARERELLAAVVEPGSPARRLVDAVLPGAAGDAVAGFGPAEPDLGTWSARSVVAGAPGTSALLVATRSDGARVLLVRGSDRPVELTAVLQRLLRVHGERVPRVEVLPEGIEQLDYHRAALAAAAPVWTGSPAGAGTAP